MRRESILKGKGNEEPKNSNCSIYIDNILAIRTMPIRFRENEKLKKLKLLHQLVSVVGYDTIVSMITDTYM